MASSCKHFAAAAADTPSHESFTGVEDFLSLGTATALLDSPPMHSKPPHLSGMQLLVYQPANAFLFVCSITTPTHLSQHPPPPHHQIGAQKGKSLLTAEKRMEKQLVFRKLLFRLGEQLSSQDLEYLRFLCKGTIRASRMEKCLSATELFEALSERGKLSSGDLSYLAQILTSIGKQSLLRELQAERFPFSAQCVDENYQLQECLVKIAQDLSSPEVGKLSYIIKASLGHISLDKIYTAIQLFQILQQRQVITVTNLKPLCQALVEIGRRDLTSLVNSYQQFAGSSDYDCISASNGECYHVLLIQP